MKILIAVPSKNRVQGLKKNTLSWLKHSKYDWKVFVEPQDETSYAEVVDKNKTVVLDQNDQGLGYAKKAIKAYAEDNNYDLIFKVDDDITAWRNIANRGKKGSKTRHPTTKEEYAEIFDKIISDSLEIFNRYPEMGGVSLPYGNQMLAVKKWTHLNARLQTAYITRTELFIPETGGRYHVFEDFATYMWIRKKGFKTLRYGLTGIDCEQVGSNAGGHQDFDRLAEAKREAEELRKIYPALQFKEVDKPWEIEPRLEGEFFNVVKL